MAEEAVCETASASRQKSCDACVKAKRGCDKLQPICSRCEEKKIPCFYAKRTYSEAFQSDFDFDSVDLDISWAGLTAPSSTTNFVNDISSSTAIWTSQDTIDLPTLDAFIDPLLTFANNHAVSTSDTQVMNNAGGQVSQQKEKEQVVSKFDYAQTPDICVR
jgi:hypothetical protein